MLNSTQSEKILFANIFFLVVIWSMKGSMTSVGQAYFLWKPSL